MSEHPNRPRTGYCWSCGGNYFTLGMKSRYVPHKFDCPRKPRRPQSPEEQDRERRELSDDWPRYPMIRWPDPSDTPWPADRTPPHRRRS